MRRATLAIVMGLALASYALPQESSSAAEKTEQGDPLIWWKWANFAILAAGLVYLIGKHVPPLFRKQSDEIQSALAQAAKIKHEAALYAAGIEQRLANLQREIENLREGAHADMAAESGRIRVETERHVQRIREQSVQEIELMTRGAKAEIRKYAAELAIGLAEQRIRTRMNPAVQENLAGGFLHDLHERATPRTAN
jgi:F0F1-type ATP synthase membrane subunit b/b'